MQTINLNQNSFRLFPTIYMVQNDTGRELKMILDDVTLAGTETGAVAIKRSDGSYYTITATIDTTNNAFDADMTQALTQPSRTECQLKVTASDDTVISTYTFIIMVQASTYGISEEQLGYSVQDIVNAASAIMNSGLTADVKQALLQIAEKVAYIDDQGASYYQALYDALYPVKTLTSISCVYTQSGTVYAGDSLDSLKTDLVVTAHFDDSSEETVTTYTLSGTLTVGTSTITVTYQSKTTTFNVTVSTGYQTLSYIQGDGAAYINTNFTPDQNTSIEIDYENTKTSSDPFQVPIGVTEDTGTSANGNGYYFYISGTNGVAVYVAHGGQATTASGVTLSVGDRKKYKLSASSYSIDDVSYGTPSTGLVPLTSSVGYPFYVFARNQGDSANTRAFSTGKVYDLKIYESGTLVRHYKPVKRTSDNEYGLYDEVNDVFYAGSGSGTITGA